ncbi:MAG: tetratricopeptide repeat protein [Gemmatimonadota bacterium]|nr:tetratricopeptide repeat protein [Gemmatimonadota bacterium]
MAAEQGHAEAQSILGGRYASGRGVPQDDTEAVRWYRRAAEQGIVGAQYELGIMYANGRGVPADLVLAHMWSNLAVANGDGRARRIRERLEWRMTPEDISRATDLARLCFASGYRECGP